MKRFAALGVILLLITFAAYAEEVERSRQFQREAAAALQSGDVALFLEKISAAVALRPTHPSLIMQFAGALAANGRADEAMAQIERVARMGMVYSPAKDPLFKSLLSSPRFIAATDAFRRNAESSGKAAPAFTIPVKGLITEGLAWDAGTRRFFVSSVRRHAVFVVDPDKRTSRFVDLPLGAFGMAVDNKRKVLWVAASSLPQVEGFTADQSDRAALMEVDLRTGRILRTFPAPAGKHLIGDVTVAANGDVYATDSSTPAIYKLRGETLEAWRSGPPFIALQGLVFSAGDRLLYVADYSKGIYAVDATTGDTAALTLPPDVTLLGVDGIYRSGPRTLIGVQNGTNPNRIIRIDLSADGLSVERVTTLAANREPMEDPTLGVMVGDQFYFNGAGQWELFGDDGKVTDDKALHEGVVMRVPVR